MDPVIKMMFDKKGFDNVNPINILSKIEIPFKTVTADDLMVMEIVNSWKNSQNLLNDCLTQDSTHGDDYISCYMTLNAWLNNDNRKLIRYSYPVKIEK